MAGAADRQQPDSKTRKPEESGYVTQVGDRSQGRNGGSQEPDVFGHFVQQMNTPDVDCKAIYSKPQSARTVSALEFDSCYHGQTTANGRSRELATPVMKPGHDGVPKPQMERLTTEGLTMDSCRLDVFMHALPSVRPISIDDGKSKSAGSAAIISEDGLMVTNKHVIEGADGKPVDRVNLTILNAEGKEEARTARVVKVEGKQDLALLQIEPKPGSSPGGNPEKFPALPLSKATSWREREPLVEMGNANGEGKISMAKARYQDMVAQRDIPFEKQPEEVRQGRTMFKLESTVPHGYSGGVVLSVPGSERRGDGSVHRLGTSAIRAITDYSDINRTAWVIPAARVQELLDEYKKEQSRKK